MTVDPANLTMSELSRRHAGLEGDWNKAVQGGTAAGNGDPNGAASPDQEGAAIETAPVYMTFACRPPAGEVVKARIWLYFSEVSQWYRVLGSETEFDASTGPAIDEIKNVGADRIYFQRYDTGSGSAEFDLQERA